MTVFRPHEVEVVRLLASRQLPPAALEELISAATFVDLEETGSGYFLTVQHPTLPAERVVCSTPLVLGRTGALTCGFLLFLEDGQLTLECHSWGESIPRGFRDCDIEVEVTT